MSTPEIIAKILRDYLENSQEPFAEAFRKHYTETPAVCNPLEDWLDNQDVMDLLHISSRTLQTLRTNGTIPYSRIGRKLYYKRADIQRILQDNYIMFELRNRNRT